MKARKIVFPAPLIVQVRGVDPDNPANIKMVPQTYTAAGLITESLNSADQKGLTYKDFYVRGKIAEMLEQATTTVLLPEGHWEIVNKGFMEETRWTPPVGSEVARFVIAVGEAITAAEEVDVKEPAEDGAKAK